MTAAHHPGSAAGSSLCAVCARAWPCPDAPAGRHRHPYSTEATVPGTSTPQHRQLQASDANPDRGPRCGECRMGLGRHDERDPLCDHHVDAVAELANALERVDREPGPLRRDWRLVAERLVRTPEFARAAQHVEVVIPLHRAPQATGHTWGNGRPNLRPVR